MNIKKVSLEFVMKLHQPEDVTAVVLFGSQASGKARSDSDVDLLVIIQEGFEQVTRWYKDYLFEITFVTENSTFDWWRTNPDHCVMLWRNANVIYASTEVESRLRKFATDIEDSGKLQMSPADVEKRRRAAAYQLTSLRALVSDDPLAANFVLGEKMAEYVGEYFTVRGLWTPEPKRRFSEIRSQDNEIGVLLDRFADPAQMLQDKFVVAETLIDTIFQSS